MSGQPGRSGPKQANLNSTRNGCSISRLTLGELPQTMRRQTQQARKYRRTLEALVLDARGEVSATDAHLIDEAATAEIHAAVCRWLLRTRLDKMTVGDVARCSEQIVKAKTIRNKAVERLQLDTRRDFLDVLYGPADNTDEPDESPVRPPTLPPVASGGEGRKKLPRRRERLLNTKLSNAPRNPQLTTLLRLRLDITMLMPSYMNNYRENTSKNLIGQVSMCL